ncbi:unnamed protein product [Urochloa humidicola]
MAAGSPPPARSECVLRGACAAMAAAGALLLGLSAQTKTVLFIQRKAVPKDVQALWVLIVAASAAAGYHVVQLARCLYMSRLAAGTGGGGAGSRRLSRGFVCVTFLLDKVYSAPECRIILEICNTRFCSSFPASLFPGQPSRVACPTRNRFHLKASLSEDSCWLGKTE